MARIQTKYYLYFKIGSSFYKIPTYNTKKYFREKTVYFCLKKDNRILYIPAVSRLLFVDRYSWNGNLWSGGSFTTYQAAIFPDGSIVSSSKTLRYKYRNEVYYFLANKQYSSFLPSFNRVYLRITSAWQNEGDDTKGFMIFSTYMNPSFPPNGLKFKFHVKAISVTGEYESYFYYEPIMEFDLWSTEEKAVRVDYFNNHRVLIPSSDRCKFEISCEISDDVVQSSIYNFYANRWDSLQREIDETLELNVQET